MSGLTSIVVPCHDDLLCTALCLQSIARHTPAAHEVVVVGNGCTDGTADWCAAHGARVVRSPVNSVSPAAATWAWPRPRATWRWSSTTAR